MQFRNRRPRYDYNFADSPKKMRFAIRLVPTSALVSVFALAFLLVMLAVSRDVPSIVVEPIVAKSSSSVRGGKQSFSESLPHSSNVDPEVTLNSATVNKQPVAVRDHSQPSASVQLPPPRIDAQLPAQQPPSEPNQQDARAPLPNSQTGGAKPPQDVKSREPGEPESTVDDGRVGWFRSWPSSRRLDNSGLQSLSAALSLSNNTLLNYFHMHKTGGVSTKAELTAIFTRFENKRRMNKRGEKLGLVETCYETAPQEGDKSLESMWRCDFGQLNNMTKAEKSSIDVLMGHQYWNEGCDRVFNVTRDVRYFSIFRHPLPRKLSFFYHFFVRNFGRDEKNVEQEEVIKFLLNQDMPRDPRIRDAGPNYYSSRLLSDGMEGFQKFQFILNATQQEKAISDAITKLDKRFALVGLQLQNEASQCMLQKLIQVFAHAHGIDTLVGTPKLSYTKLKINTGDYPWTAPKIWKAMTVEQRKKYKEVEKVDLAIYHKVVEKFKKDVKLFSCGHKVVEDRFLEDNLY